MWVCMYVGLYACIYTYIHMYMSIHVLEYTHRATEPPSHRPTQHTHTYRRRQRGDAQLEAADQLVRLQQLRQYLFFCTALLVQKYKH